MLEDGKELWGCVCGTLDNDCFNWGIPIGSTVFMEVSGQNITVRYLEPCGRRSLFDQEKDIDPLLWFAQYNGHPATKTIVVQVLSHI